MTLRLVETCHACPEQYDVYLGDKQVAYFRLRHGHFRAEVPDVGGTTIFEGHPEGDGRFTDAERDFWLNRACTAVLANWVAHNLPGVGTSPRLYEIDAKYARENEVSE